jgi:hypothetical protein
MSLWMLMFLGQSLAWDTQNCIQTGDYRAGRPTLSGPVETVDSSNGRFRVHYTLEGEDTPDGDKDEFGVPLMVERVLSGLSTGEEAFAKRGYRGVNLDDGAEGSDAIDVYLKHIDANGYANAVRAESGTKESCYIRVNSELGDMGGQLVESVTLHELQHCVQYAYTTSADTWLYESGATFEQYRAIYDDGLELALAVLFVDRLTAPERPLNNSDGRYHYAGFLFMKFWEEYLGADPGRVPALWEALSFDPNWRDSLRSESQRLWQQPFDEVFVEYARFNGFACAREDGNHYSDTLLPCIADVSVPVELVEGGAGTVSVSLSQTEFTASYAQWAEVSEGKTGVLTCSAPNDSDGELRVQLMGLDSEGRMMDRTGGRVGDSGESFSLTLPMETGGSYFGVFASTGTGPVSATCVLDEAEVEQDKQGCSCSKSPMLWSSQLFPLGALGMLVFFWRRKTLKLS